jgi:methionine-rich copper-binding protein CopC
MPLMARPRVLRLLLLAVTAAALVLGPIGSAAAHDVLVSTAPAADTALETAPASVTLMFSDEPQALGTEVVVSGPDGVAVSDGAPQVDGTAVRQSLRDGLPAGTYTVDWRATSADGHPLSGTFTYDVTQGSPAGAMGGEGAPAADATAASNGSSSFPVVWVVIAVIAVGAVVLAVRQLRRPS